MPKQKNLRELFHDIDSENQVRIWTRHFGVTQQELARAIETVGNSAAAVRKQLAASRPAPQSK
jgi:hypothetical protein